MNTTASSFSENSWSRRCSTETIFSIQGKETDFVRDTSDTEWCSDDQGVEYEPATEPEDEGPVTGESSGQSDNEIIETKVIEVSVGDDGELQLADSEQTASSSDSEMDLHDYWLCAHCRAQNNNPLYRYCEKCFKVRKNFFPPRPKRKHKRKSRIETETLPRTLSQDSGVESVVNSQELAQSSQNSQFSETSQLSQNTQISRSHLKRRAESADRHSKRVRTDYSDSDTDSDSGRRRKSKSADLEVKPLVKMVSDPALVIDDSVNITGDASDLKDNLDSKDNMCIICTTEPKSGVFVHGRIAHICCCYKCAVKVWAKAKRCPVCNCKVSNVLKAVVM